MNCHVYLSASMEKINQDITVSSILKQNTNQVKEFLKIPPVNRFFLKIWSYKSLPEATLLKIKKIKEKSYPYVHTLSLAYKECKRLLWNQQCENKKIDKKNCCVILLPSTLGTICKRHLPLEEERVVPPKG